MRAFVFGVLIAIAGCTPASDNGSVAAAPAAPAPVASPASSAPPPAAPAPAAPTPAATTPALQTALPGPDAARRVPEDRLVQDGVDYACSVPADCAVKNVGNCCGAYPQCVNKDSPTFPDRVKAQCGASGMSSVCGFQDIASCDCVEGRCTGIAGAGVSGDVQKD